MIIVDQGVNMEKTGDKKCCIKKVQISVLPSQYLCLKTNLVLASSH